MTVYRPTFQRWAGTVTCPYESVPYPCEGIRSKSRWPKPQWPADVVVIARIAGELVMIEEDRTDKPLVDRLVAAGIPRDKIILAYAGEPLPDMG